MNTPGPHADIVATDRWVATIRGRIFTRIWTGPAAQRLAPIILLHDSLGSVELWRDFPARLAAGTGRTVIAYDRLGFGRSDPRTDVLTTAFIGDEADTVFAAVRAQLGVERFVVFGHSVGGAMAIHCAARYPDACKAVITESAQVFAEETTLEGIRAAQAQFADPEQLKRLEKYHGGKAQWVLDAWTGTWLSPPFASWTLRSLLPQLCAPLLAIHGDDDEYGTTLHPRLIAEWSGAGVRVAIMPQAQHLPHREQPGQVVALVRDFLAQPQAPTPSALAGRRVVDD